MSDSNLASLASVAETTLGNPSTSQLQEIRFTGESLKFTKETVSSAEIRSDRQTSDMQKVFGQPDGGFNFELSYAFILPFLAAALQAEWVNFAITVAATLNAGTQLVTAAPGTFDTIPVGAMVKITGAAVPANNTIARVVAKANDGSTLTLAAGSITTTAGSASLTFTGQTISNGVTRQSRTFEKRILNGEGKDFYQRYFGMVADTMDIRIESKKIIVGSIGFVGTSYGLSDTGYDAEAGEAVEAIGTLTLTGNAVANETVTIGNQIYTWKASPAATGQVLVGANASDSLDNLAAAIAGNALNVVNPFVTAAVGPGDTMVALAIQAGAIGNTIATTETMTNGSWGAATLVGGATGSSGYDAPEAGPIMNGTSNMGTIQIDGATATDRFKAITIQIANNVRGKDACSFEGNWDIGLGQTKVTGSLNAYFRNNLLPTKIKEHTSFGLEFYVQDSEGARLYFYLPAVKPAQGDPAITAINTDVMLETSYEAIYGDNPTGKTILIDAIPA